MIVKQKWPLVEENDMHLSAVQVSMDSQQTKMLRLASMEVSQHSMLRGRRTKATLLLQIASSNRSRKTMLPKSFEVVVELKFLSHEI